MPLIVSHFIHIGMVNYTIRFCCGFYYVESKFNRLSEGNDLLFQTFFYKLKLYCKIQQLIIGNLS